MDRINALFQKAAYDTKGLYFEDAIAAYEEIITLSPHNFRNRHLALWGIGEIHLNNQVYDKAKKYLSRAVALAPQESSYHYLLGCTYTYMNQIDKAIHHLEEATRLDGAREIYWNQIGWVVGYNRDIDQGIKYLKKALKINPDHTKSLKDICILYMKNGKYDIALLCIEEAVKKSPYNEDLADIKRDVQHFKNNFDRLSKKEGPLKE